MALAVILLQETHQEEQLLISANIYSSGVSTLRRNPTKYLLHICIQTHINLLIGINVLYIYWLLNQHQLSSVHKLIFDLYFYKIFILF